MASGPDEFDRKAIRDRIILRESAVLREAAAGLARESGEAREALAAVCHLLNLRQRYFGAAGEYFSVQDPDGMDVVDALDDVLLGAVHDVLEAWLAAARPQVPPPIRLHLVERYQDLIENLPRDYPVAYMVLFVVRRAFELFEPLARQKDPEVLAGFEAGFAEFLGEIARRYVRSRTTPVLRHHADLRRERSVVARLRCRCGKEEYRALREEAGPEAPGGAPSARIDLRCQACGDVRSLRFARPHAADLAALRKG